MFARKFFAAIVGLCFVATGAASSFAQTKVPFLPDDDIQTVRQKIEQNGYSFQVRDYKRDFGKDFFVPGKHSSKQTVQFPAKTVPISQLQTLPNLPEKFDWRDRDGKSFIGPVRNQSALGSCYSFGACAAAESVFNIHSNRYNERCVDFSESYIAWVLGNTDGYSDHFSEGDGADYEYYELTALTKYGLQTGIEGICLENDFPYQINKPIARILEESPTYPIVQFDSWQRVYPLNYEDTTDAIKTAIMTYGVVDAAVYVTSAFQKYAGGVFEDTQTTPTSSPYYYQATNHAISLVGWDDNPPEGGEGCWILRNSWGSEWGEDGYMRIRYHSACVNTEVCYLAYNTNSIHSFTGNASQTSRDSAVAYGNLKTNGQPLDCYFEYGVDDFLDMKTPLLTLTPVDGQTIYSVSGPLSDLETNAKYQYRLVAQLAGDASAEVISGKTLSFQMKEPEIDNSSLVLNVNHIQTEANAWIECNNLATSYWVEYGSDDLFAQTSPTKTIDRYQECSITFADLQPDTEYSYRFVADNGVGDIVRGEEKSFKTPPYILFDSFESAGFYAISSDDANMENKAEFETMSWTADYFLNGEMVSVASYYWSTYKNGIALPRIEPTAPFEGSKNRGFTFNRIYNYKESFEEQIGYKGWQMSPALHLSQFPQAYLHFAYAAPSCNGVNDELRIYYKSQSADDWTPVPGGEYTSAANGWAKRTLQLPNLSDDYQIAFEATANFGWGVTLDNVLITPTEDTNVTSWSLY